MQIASGRAVMFWLAAELGLGWMAANGLYAAEGDTAAASPTTAPAATTSTPAPRPDTPFPVLATPAPPAATSGVEPSSPEPLPPNLAPSLGTLLTLVVVYLVVLGGLGWFVVWLYRRLGRRVGGLVAGAEVKVCYQRMIGQRQSLVIVRYRDHEYFLGVTPQQITRLDMRPIDADGELNQLDPAVLKTPAPSTLPKSG